MGCGECSWLQRRQHDRESCMMRVARAMVIALLAVFTYLGGAKLGEGFMRKKIVRRSAEIESRVRGSRQLWAFETPGGRVHKADSAMARWRLLLLGAAECVSCVRQQAAYLKDLSQRDADFLNQIEVWLISDQFVAWGETKGASARLRMRNFRYSPVGAVEFTVGTIRPLAILIDPRGVVQRLRAGFLPGDEVDFLGDVDRLVGAGLLNPRN